jgi:formylglycine-generating enzyme required for sulfatase activity
MSDPIDPWSPGDQTELEELAALEREVTESQDEDFVRLLKIAKLDPSLHLRFGNFSGLDFSGCDLSGCDFTGANMTSCRFDYVKIAGARFDRAQVRRDQLCSLFAETRLRTHTPDEEEVYVSLASSSGARAEDWDEHVRRWVKAERPGGDQHLPDLAIFSDAPFAPEVVVLPMGQFRMGSPRYEEGRYPDEGPRRRLRFNYRFAISRFPVTFEEYDVFCKATQRRMPDDEGWGRGRRPVINVSWKDADAYVRWLSKVIGMTSQRCYRLPSEAEWEYACRGGATTRYSWGDTMTPQNARYGDSPMRHTSEVGAYPANFWGLSDMHGNVLEWVADDWHDNYKNAPLDGSAWMSMEPNHKSGCVLRGGSWSSGPRDCRAAFRYRDHADVRIDRVGFRVARSLTTLLMP